METPLESISRDMVAQSGYWFSEWTWREPLLMLIILLLVSLWNGSPPGGTDG